MSPTDDRVIDYFHWALGSARDLMAIDSLFAEHRSKNREIREGRGTARTPQSIVSLLSLVLGSRSDASIRRLTRRSSYGPTATRARTKKASWIYSSYTLPRGSKRDRIYGRYCQTLPGDERRYKETEGGTEGENEKLTSFVFVEKPSCMYGVIPCIRKAARREGGRPSTRRTFPSRSAL